MKPETEDEAETALKTEDVALDVPRLVSLWESLIPEKWKELRAGNAPFISVWNPRWTMSNDLEERRKATKKAMKWTEEWFQAKGVEMECVLESDGESFGIRLVG